jgi:hypothetical protein
MADRKAARSVAQCAASDDTHDNYQAGGENMRGLWTIGTAALLAGCVGTPSLSGTFGAPTFASLQQMCGGQSMDYGSDAQPVYSALFDAYVASRRQRVSKDDYCAFQATLAQQYTALGTSSEPQAREKWAAFFLAQRVKAIGWRAAVDPTLRGG